MVQENPAKQYVVRVHNPHLESPGNQEYRLWAFSAEDAKSQVNLELDKSSARGRITYVGPYNPECKCAGQCRCGILTAEQAESRGE